MARDRKRSKQRQQRARSHRDDARATAQHAFGRTPDEDAGALNGDEQRHELEDRVAEAHASIDPVADPTADPALASAAEPDFDEPVRPRFEASDYDELDESSDGGAVAGVPARRAPAVRPAKGNRVTSFLRASWAELQRVQWPNRHQVFQATAVVLGFVVVAGAFLAGADFVAGKIVDAIL